MTAPPRLLVESSADRRIAECLFHQEVKDRLLAVEARLTASGAISAASLFLLQGPEQPVALLLNTETMDPVQIEEEWRGPTTRILARIALKGWHLAPRRPPTGRLGLARPPPSGGGRGR